MPAFSFSKQKKQPSFIEFDKKLPNVGMYNITQLKFNSKIKTAPSISLSKASRQNSNKNKVPGPGTYETSNLFQNSKSKGVSMKGSHETKIKEEGPSPNQYDPKVQFPTKKFSFSKSLSKSPKNKGPDPSTYNVKYQILNTTSNYVFSKSQRQPWQKKTWMKNVGPGYHQIKQKLIFQQKNKFSFPKNQKFKENILQIKQKSQIPGPGKYEITDARENKKSIKFSLATKALAIKSEAPGPGAYDISDNFQSTKSNIIIGNSARQNNYETLVPGPGTYDLQNTIKLKSKQSPNVIFCKEKRMMSRTMTVDLGPGQYEISTEIDNQLKKNKGFSLKGKTHTEKNQPLPGPQAYNPDFTKLYSSCERFVFGKDRRLQNKVNKNPGPGSYEPKDKIFLQTFFFNKAQSKPAFIKNRSNSIGPGQYKLKPYFGQFQGKDKLVIKTQKFYV